MTSTAFRRNSAYAEVIQLKKRPKNRKLKLFVVEGITDKVLFEYLLKKYRGKIRIIPIYQEHYLKIPCSGISSARETPLVSSRNKYKKSIRRNNKGEVIKTINSCNTNQINYVYGIVDADFMHLSGKIKRINNLLYTTYHDIDIEIFTAPEVLEKFLKDAFPDRQLQVNQIKNLCLEIAAEYGKYLYILERRKIHSNNRNRVNFSLHYFLTVKDSKIHLDQKTIKEVIQHNWDIISNELMNEITRLNLNEKKLKILANGHDFFTVLWKIKEENLYDLSKFPQASEFLNLNIIECEKKLKLCYFQSQMLEKNFWNQLCTIVLSQ
ncbi:MAG: DUF4435 domain-containing protein [Patescibacteria group bacterium]|nr:DUF4435 domain-containing protein [Patescibacteria group bacterium]